MKLNEFYEPAKDTVQQRHKTDTRKKMLSLEELGKLRKIRELKVGGRYNLFGSL